MERTSIIVEYTIGLQLSIESVFYCDENDMGCLVLKCSCRSYEILKSTILCKRDKKIINICLFDNKLSCSLRLQTWAQLFKANDVVS